MRSLRITDPLQRGKAAINTPKNDGVQRMVDITAKKAEGKGKGYEKWATLYSLKQMAVIYISIMLGLSPWYYSIVRV